MSKYIESKNDLYWYNIESVEDIVWLMGTDRINNDLKEFWLSMILSGEISIEKYKECGQIVYWD